MKVACLPGTVHALKSITWCSLPAESSVFTASPGCRSAAGISLVMSFLLGAKPAVLRPGGGNPHAHDTSPEQSERYGSHTAFFSRMQTAGHAGSPASLWPLGLWQ